MLLMSGCAIIDDSAAVEKQEAAEVFAPIDESLGYRRVEHGIITVREIRTRSDIIIEPPSVQHVVWSRGGNIEAPPAAAVGPENIVPTRSEPDANRALDNWPLLEEDMNFDTEIGRVDMCRPKDTCYETSGCPDLVPCERANELACFRVKQGDYCLEANQ